MAKRPENTTEFARSDDDAKAAAGDGAGPRYVVQSNLLHDGTPCIPGDTVPGAMFTDAQAAYLVACGTLAACLKP